MRLNMKKAELIAWLLGTFLAVFVVSCSETITDSHPDDGCVMDADSSYVCDGTKFKVYQ